MRGENDTLIFGSNSWHLSNITEDDWLNLTNGRRSSMVPKGPFIGVTDLRRNADYVIYAFWTKTFLTSIIPAVLLIFFNYKVCKTLSFCYLFFM